MNDETRPLLQKGRLKLKPIRFYILMPRKPYPTIFR